MSDLSAGFEAALTGNTDGGASAETPSAEGAPTTPAYDTSGLSPYAQNWLAGLPDTDRAKGAEYVRSWDQGFQQYSQRVQSQLSPYTQLGSVDELTQIKNIVENLKADPQGFVQMLIDNGFYKPGPAAPAQQSAPQFFDAQGNPIEVPKPQDFTQNPEWRRMQQAVGAVAQQVSAQREAVEQAEAMKQLDQMVAQAHQKHGQFNELYVYQLMAQGLSIDAAVQQWKNELASAMEAQKPAPRTMSASSAPPVAPGPLDTADQRTTALAQMLQALGNQ